MSPTPRAHDFGFMFCVCVRCGLTMEQVEDGPHGLQH